MSPTPSPGAVAGATQPSGWSSWGSADRRPGITAPMRRFLDETFAGRLTPPAPPVAADAVTLPPSALPAAVLDELGRHAEVDTSSAGRTAHALGRSYRDLLRLRAGDLLAAPDAVVAPLGPDQVQAVLDVCARERIAVVPFGGGTSVVGGVEPLRGEFSAVLALDLRRLDRMIELDPISHTARLQPGLRGPQAEELLNARGYTLGHFPQSYEFATIGGYAATRSAGQASTGYGRSDDMVMALTAATPSGPLRLGRAPRSAAGPDLRQLLLGSEGAFGVITEVTMCVCPLPAVRRYEGWFFKSLQAGLEVVRTLEQERLAPDVSRLSDEDETRVNLAISGHGGGAAGAYLTLRGARAMGIFGWEGSADSVAVRRKLAARILRKGGGIPVGTSAGETWAAGRFAAPYLRDDLMDAGVLVETLETATTWQQLPRLYAAVRAALAGSLDDAVVGCHVSHLYPAGASLYFTVLAPASATDPMGQWDAAKRAASDAMIAAGGTITHHHAVGRDHAPWLADEIGELGVDVLRAVKRQLDPGGILNPGKLLP